MTSFSVTVDIQALPIKVWAVLRDVERWPEWTSTVISLERMDSGPLAVGSRARIRQPKLRPGVWEVTELDEAKSFTWATRNQGLRIAGRHDVEASENGSRATLSLEFSGLLGPLLARVYGKLNREYLATEASGLKARSEESPI